jgi:hypothetical protein
MPGDRDALCVYIFWQMTNQIFPISANIFWSKCKFTYTIHINIVHYNHISFLPKNAYYFSSTLAARQHHGRQVPETGLPDFQTKIPNLGKFWKALECKRLVYSMAIWNH